MQLFSKRAHALALFISLVASARSAQGQGLIHELFGGAANDQFGAASAWLPDVDGDGLSDLAIASPGAPNALGNVRVFSGADGHELWRVNGTVAGARFGTAIAGLGDVNGDGRGDLAVGAHLSNFAGASGAGEVRVLSGVSGALIRSHRGDSGGDHFGWSVASAGDVDLDLVLDYVVGAIDDDNTGASSGSARVFSGVSGATLFTVNGSAAQQVFGYSVGAAGDVNGDGRADIVVGGPYFASSLQNGIARVHSGAGGALLWSWNGALSRDAFGSAVAGVSDVDGDLVPDLLVGARQLPTGAKGYARVFSGASGLVLHHIAGANTHQYFGTSLAAAGDIDFDGRGDFVVGTPDAFDAGTRSGVARLYSGASATLVFEMVGTAPGQRLGSSLAAGSDCTGEGVADLLVGAAGDGSIGVSAGAAFAFSGNDEPPKPPPLSGDVSEISRSARESQQLTLEAGVEHAGARYLILGSLSGTEPGIQLGGVLLPLNHDRYMRFLRQHPRLSSLENGEGVLDATGHASATFTPLRQWRAASIVGLTFHHAYLVLSNGSKPVFASNAVAVTVVP